MSNSEIILSIIELNDSDNDHLLQAIFERRQINSTELERLALKKEAHALQINCKDTKDELIEAASQLRQKKKLIKEN